MRDFWYIIGTAFCFHNLGFHFRALMRHVYGVPNLIVPSILRSAGFLEIKPVQILVPTSWRDPNEDGVCIRNARTGEE